MSACEITSKFFPSCAVPSSIVNPASSYCAVLLHFSAEVRQWMNNKKMREDVRAIEVPMNLKDIHTHTNNKIDL